MVGIGALSADGISGLHHGGGGGLPVDDGVAGEDAQVVVIMDDADEMVAAEEELPGINGVGGAQREGVSADVGHVGADVIHVEDGVAVALGDAAGVVHHQHALIDGRHRLLQLWRRMVAESWMPCWWAPSRKRLSMAK